jgi:hypothetical protein
MNPHRTLALAAAISGLVVLEPARADDPVLSPSGFLDVYYSYDFNNPGSGRRPAFLFNHTRHNAFSVNLALVGLEVEHPSVRAALGLMAGTYAEDNLAHEEPLLRHLWEANLGVRLTDGLWLDAGVFESHLGYESAISTLNPTLTRSLAAESSPYYLAGAKLSWEFAPGWAARLIVANGWQNIAETPGNRAKGFGTQVVLDDGDGLEFNWSTFISDDAPRGVDALRLFNDIYAGVRLGDLSLLAAFDLGAQQDGGGGWDMWFTFYALGRLHLSQAFAIALRAEHFSDPAGVIIALEGRGVHLSAASLNADLTLGAGAMLRVEARAFFASRPVFGDAALGRWGGALTSSAAWRF